MGINKFFYQNNRDSQQFPYKMLREYFLSLKCFRDERQVIKKRFHQQKPQSDHRAILMCSICSAKFM